MTCGEAAIQPPAPSVGLFQSLCDFSEQHPGADGWLVLMGWADQETEKVL